MKNLTTRKIVLGLLVGFVLALGVQGTADAITKFTKTASTDYQVKSINEPFTITFSISIQSSISIKNSDGRLVAEDGTTFIDSSGYPGTWGDHDSNVGTPDTFARTSGASKVDDSLRYHYNDEAIGISATRNGSPVSGELTLRRNGTSLPLVGDTRVSGIPTDASASLYESAESSNRRLSGSLTGVATNHGVYVITINDITSDADTPDGYTAATSITFTIYVWRNVSTSRGATITTGLSDDIAEQYGTVPLSVVLTGTGSDYAKVEFEVTRGPGRLYEDKDGDGKADKSASSKLTTFTNNLGTDNTVNVVLMPNRGTTHVRAWVSGNAYGATGKSTEAIYSYGYSQLTKVSGDSPIQRAPAESRLEDPFVVQLFDSTGRTTIPGAMITFTPSGGSTLAKDPNFPSDLYPANFPTTADTAGTVTTDSNGKASIFLVLGTTGAQSVTAQFGTDTSGAVTFTAEIGSADPRTPQTIKIMSGTDGQKANQYGVPEKALTVIVRDQYGDRLPEAVVEFEARDGGSINNPRPGDPGIIPTADTSPTLEDSDSDGRRRDIITDNSGMASIRYLASEDSGPQKVTATLEDGSRRFKTFTINGPPSSNGDDSSDRDDDDDDTSVLTRGSLSISVSPDTGNTRTVTVTALNPAGTAARGISVILNVSNGATLSRTSGPTPLTSTLTLPGTAGDYTLTATTTADYTPDTETITVTLPGNLSLDLIGDQVNGSQTVRVTARNAAGTLETTAVTVTLSGAGISRTVDVTGTQNVPIPLPTTSGTLTARATGYKDGEITLPARAVGTTPNNDAQPRQTGPAGVADSIEIDGDRQRSGRVNQVLRLRARVLDANDNGVSGVRVTFRVLAPGQGRLSQRGNGRATQVETDRSGYATASLTPLGGNHLIVEAKAAQVTAAVTFIIDVGGGTGETAETDATGSTASPQTYNVGDKVPISLEGTLSFTNPRTLSGITYTCVGDGECVVSYGLVTKGQIQAAPAAKTTPPRAYQVGDKIPISLEDTLTFTGKHTVNGTSYTCVGDGECVVSYGLVTKGQIEVTTATATTPDTSEIMPEVLLGADRRPPMVWVDGGKLYALVGAAVHAFAPDVENVMNIAVSGDMLYWTEQTGKNAGTINAMHLDGTGAKALVSIHAVPRGIAVDAVAKRLYWTNSQGWIQSSNLEGTARRNVISGGLEDPLGIRVGNGWLYWTQGDGRLQAVNLTGTQAVRTLATGMQSAEGLSVFENKVYWTQMTGRNAGTINAVNLDGTGAKALVSIQAVPRGIVVDGVAKRLYWTNSQGWIQSSNLEGTARRNVAKGLGSPGGIALSATLEVSAMAEKDAASPTAAAPNYDVDGSGTVDNADLFLVSLAVGTDNAQYDVNGDGTVNDKDIALVRDNRDNGAAAAPMVFGVKLTAEQVGRLQAQIDLLIVSGDRSPDALKTLVYLQQLIATARPEQTQLLANYPNPFNPETWIPYELATDTDVRITIYAANGVVVRTLQLGQQSAGYYTDRERAAYWDGRNASGEQVASGVYFYQLETDEISSLRKMVILK